MPDKKQDGKYSHEAYYKFHHSTSTAQDEFIISAQAESEEESLRMFKKIKEMMKDS